MPKLKWNILNFCYGVNFKYEGMHLQSFDRFSVVTKFKMPKTEDLHLTTIHFNSTSNYLNIEKDENNFSFSYFPKLLAFC